jgi:hypothetical protein
MNSQNAAAEPELSSRNRRRVFALFFRAGQPTETKCRDMLAASILSVLSFSFLRPGFPSLFLVCYGVLIFDISSRLTFALLV